MSKFFILGLLFLLTACDSKKEEATKAYLPWKVTAVSESATHVLGVDIGSTTFKELMFALQLLAEPALFQSNEGKLTLEAYFGKKKFGILEARLVAEMDADEAILKKMLKEHVGRDSTPSNHWKYQLNIENTRIANELRVWRLVYMPVGDYEVKQIKFFGEPEEKIQINDTAQYLLYPSKGLVVLWDTDGKEVFYYVAKKDFERLKKTLPMKKLILSQ